jgi:hypothetical protein
MTTPQGPVCDRLGEIEMDEGLYRIVPKGGQGRHKGFPDGFLLYDVKAQTGRQVLGLASMRTKDTNEPCTGIVVDDPERGPWMIIVPGDDDVMFVMGCEIFEVLDECPARKQ